VSVRRNSSMSQFAHRKKPDLGLGTISARISPRGLIRPAMAPPKSLMPILRADQLPRIFSIGRCIARVRKWPFAALGEVQRYVRYRGADPKWLAQAHTGAIEPDETLGCTRYPYPN